jgi:hypothetical protein
LAERILNAKDDLSRYLREAESGRLAKFRDSGSLVQRVPHIAKQRSSDQSQKGKRGADGRRCGSNGIGNFDAPNQSEGRMADQSIISARTAESPAK